MLLTKAECHSEWPLYDDIFHPPLLRLKSRKPRWRVPETIDVTSQWQSATAVNSSLVEDPTIRLPGYDLHRRQWSLLNHFRATAIRATRNVVSLTTNYVTVVKPKQCHISSTLVHLPSSTVDYCVYMKQMRWPSTG